MLVLALFLLLPTCWGKVVFSRGPVTISTDGPNCDLDISYSDLQLICHRGDRPAVNLGIGEFVAEDNLGNFELNDTVTQRVNLTEFEVGRAGTISLFNTEAGVGLELELFEDTEDGIFMVEVKFPDRWYPEVEKYNRIWVELVAEESEYVWGGGEQYTYLNLRGRNYPIWVREQGVGRNKSSILTQVTDQVSGGGGDYHTTYWPQASYLSSRRYYMESSHSSYHELDFTQEDRHSVYWHLNVPSRAEGSYCLSCRLSFIIKPRLLDIVTSLNPGQPELPEWVYNGAVIGVQGGTDRMLQVLDSLQSQGVQVSAMWIQDWSGKITTEFGTRVFWNWKWNETWYPDLDEIIKDLDAVRGVKVTAYITAHLNTDGEVYQNCSNEDYWLTIEDGERLLQDFGEFSVSTVDILKEPADCNCINTARLWYKQLIQENLIDLGFAGWMADFGEYTPTSARSKFGERWWENNRGEILHQKFSEEWAKLNREAVEEAGQLGNILYWMRSGGLASKYHQVMSWAGDQTVDWTLSDGLPSSIVSALSLAMSGMGLSHSDIGGYTTVQQIGVVRDKELLLRWAEYAAFTPMMRTHEGNQPESNHQVYTDEDTMRQFGRLTQIYVDMGNYTREAVRQNAAEHIPVMRPVFLQYEDDRETFLREYEYMFGDDVLVSPVLSPDTSEWTAYLPANGDDTWIHLWSAVEHAGGQYVSVGVPLGEPAVFYRAGSKWAGLFASIGEKFRLRKN